MFEDLKNIPTLNTAGMLTQKVVRLSLDFKAQEEYLKEIHGKAFKQSLIVPMGTNIVPMGLN